MSNITYVPLFASTEHTNADKSVTEYKIAASASTRTIGIIEPLLEVQIAETLRSILQMRYARNPENFGQASSIQVEVCLPEAHKLLASVMA
jgi:hypothetical protein